MDKNRDWQPIEDQSAVSVLLDQARDFHDSVSIKAGWEGAEQFDSANYLEMKGFGALHLEVESQFADVGTIEIRFLEVESFRYDYHYDAEPSFEFAGGKVSVRLGCWVITAGRIEYTL